VASWDHTVGKGIVSPHLRRYIVQNTVMRDDLVRYHRIAAQRIAVTGWPQTDVFHRRRPRHEFDAIVRGLGVDPSRPVVLVMGNTPTNAPFEARFVERLVSWWDESGASGRFSLLFRPHPRDRAWRERFSAALAKDGVGVQEPSFTDLDALATLLQHGDAVVSNAGTILLDALVNDRPTICVLYDEGAPAGESFAMKNVSGEHYRQLMESDAFYRAERFEDVISGIDRALARPGELAEERARAAGEVVGAVDGQAAERVAGAVVSALPESRS
jgi:CDP-glycerol glycerophosphotransferase (TagB/SpsB family)